MTDCGATGPGLVLSSRVLGEGPRSAVPVMQGRDSMTQSFFRRSVTSMAAVAMLVTGFTVPASAGTISTGQAHALAERSERLDRIGALLVREDIAAQLERFGVEPALAAERAAALSDQELIALEQGIEQATAGGDVLAVLGVLFVVLLVLELVGVTDVFSRL